MINNLEFSRIDDRLIHGQVVTQWIKQYNKVQHILVVDDKTAADPFMGKMFSYLVPSGITIENRTIDEAAELLNAEGGLEKPTMLIAKVPDTIKALRDKGCQIDYFNIGGMGLTGDRKKFFQNISMSPSEEEVIKSMIDDGVKVEIQIIPAQGCYNVADLLAKEK